MNNEVTLDLYEMQSASHLGILRCLESKKHKESWGYNYKGSLNDQMAKSISGAMGEVATAKFLDCSKFEYHCNVGGVPDLIFKDLKYEESVLVYQMIKYRSLNAVYVSFNY